MMQDEDREITFIGIKRKLSSGKILFIVPIENIAKVFISSNGAYKEKICPICQEVMNENFKLCKLKCEHVFHRHCFKRQTQACSWLCPLCRFDTIKELR